MNSERKSLVIYFRRADENYAVGYIDKGNIEVIAEYIRDLIWADLFKVEPQNPYFKEYNTCIEESRERQNSHNAPIIDKNLDLTPYEVIYIGAPVYGGEMPEEMVTALKNLDFTGKIIRPFVTHEGSGLAGIPNQLKKICKNAKVKNGLAIRGSIVYEAKDQVQNWL